MIETIGFRNCLLTCAGIMSFNVIIGTLFSYRPKGCKDEGTEIKDTGREMRRYSLKFQGRNYSWRGQIKGLLGCEKNWSNFFHVVKKRMGIDDLSKLFTCYADEQRKY